MTHHHYEGDYQSPNISVFARNANHRRLRCSDAVVAWEAGKSDAAVTFPIIRIVLRNCNVSRAAVAKLCATMGKDQVARNLRWLDA